MDRATAPLASMKWFFLPLFLTCFYSTRMVCPAIPPKGPSQNPTELEGEWRVISWQNELHKLAGHRVAGFRITFRGKRYGLSSPTQNSQEVATMRLDPAKSPKEIDLKEDLKSANEPLQFFGIYKIEGDRLTIVFNEKHPRQRPTAFPSEAKAGLTVWKLRRAPSNK